MTPDIIFVVSLIFLGFIFFVTELFSIDVTAMVLLSILFLFGYLTPEEALSGFSNPAVLTIAFLFIISHALQKTGILEYLIIRIRRLADRSILLGRTVYLLTIGLASAVVNNTAIVAIFMPVTIRLAQKYKMSPSKMLIPLSYAAILGGTLTLVGTSTNLLVNSIYINVPGVEPLGMFEFSLAALCLLTLGMLYMFIVSPLLLPKRKGITSLKKHAEQYIAEIELKAGNEGEQRTKSQRASPAARPQCSRTSDNFWRSAVEQRVQTPPFVSLNSFGLLVSYYASQRGSRARATAKNTRIPH